MIEINKGVMPSRLTASLLALALLAALGGCADTRSFYDASEDQAQSWKYQPEEMRWRFPTRAFGA